MLRRIVPALTLASALALMTLPLSACGTRPVVSNAPACAAWKPIDAISTDNDIFLLFIANEHTMRPLTDQVNGNNKERSRFCKQ